MATFTSRLGLKLPAGADKRKIADINANMAQIDKMAGVIWVNDGITPPNTDLFDGAIIRERGTKLLRVALSNGVGGFTLEPLLGLANTQWGVFNFNATGAVSTALTALGNTTISQIAGTLSPTDITVTTSNHTLTLNRNGKYDIQISAFLSGSTAAFNRFVEIKCAADATWDTRAPEQNSVLWTLNAQVYITGIPRVINFNCQQDSGLARDFNSVVKISRTDLI